MTNGWAGWIVVASCTLAASGARADDAATGTAERSGADRRGNVLSLRKSVAPRADDPAPTLEGFVRLAAGRDLEALLQSFDDVPLRANGEAAIRHFIATEVIPFFADAARLDSQMRVTMARFEDGSEGRMAYAYVVTTSGPMKPFVLAWRGESPRLRVMDLQLGRCVQARHPVTAGRCDRQALPP